MKVSVHVLHVETYALGEGIEWRARVAVRIDDVGLIRSPQQRPENGWCPHTVETWIAGEGECPYQVNEKREGMLE